MHDFTIISLLGLMSLGAVLMLVAAIISLFWIIT